MAARWTPVVALIQEDLLPGSDESSSNEEYAVEHVMIFLDYFLLGVLQCFFFPTKFVH